MLQNEAGLLTYIILVVHNVQNYTMRHSEFYLDVVCAAGNK